MISRCKSPVSWVQEAISNVRKHSGTNRPWSNWKIKGKPGTGDRDEGRGFDVDRTAAKSNIME